jgi:hypothetical protein
MLGMKSKGITKFVWLIIATIALVVGTSMFLSSYLSREVAIADIAGVNFKIMNTAELVENFLKQDLFFKSIKDAKDLPREETDWNNDFKNKLSGEISGDSSVYGYACSFNDIPATIDVNDVSVSGRSIHIGYDITIDYEYRSLERNGQVDITLPCTGYYYSDDVEEDCPAVCQWCNKCDDNRVNEYSIGKCLEPTSSCTYSCKIGYCGASCENDNSCLCPTDACENKDNGSEANDWVDYPEHGVCMTNCICDVRIDVDGICKPTITLNSEKCANE